MPYTWRFDVVLTTVPILLQGLGMTCLLTVLAMAIGLVVGLLIALMRLARWRVVSLPAYAFTELFRTTPLLVQVVWVFTVLPLTTGITLSPFFSGLLALALNVAAFLAAIYSTGLIAVVHGQRHCALALAMHPGQ